MQTQVDIAFDQLVSLVQKASCKTVGEIEI